ALSRLAMLCDETALSPREDMVPCPKATWISHLVRMRYFVYASGNYRILPGKSRHARVLL
ncbi:MAG: hypothetical protein ACXQTW_05210, partial [Candidatus Methanospirareceae archaeon]